MPECFICGHDSTGVLCPGCDRITSRIADRIREEEDERILEEVARESKKTDPNVTAIVVPSEPPPVFKISPRDDSIGAYRIPSQTDRS